MRFRTKTGATRKYIALLRANQITRIIGDFKIVKRDMLDKLINRSDYTKPKQIQNNS